MSSSDRFGVAALPGGTLVEIESIVQALG